MKKKVIGLSIMKNTSLVTRITLFVLVALVLCSMVIGVFAYLLNRNEVITANAEKALAIAQTVVSMLDTTQFSEIMQTKKTNDYYYEYTKFLDKTLEKCDLVYLYILDKNYGAEVVYFAEGYPSIARPDEPRILFQDTESVNAYSPELFDTLKSSKDSITSMYDLGGYGKMVSGFSPILDEFGNVLGVVGVDIAINTVIVSSNRFGAMMIAIVLGICLIVALLSVRFIKSIVASLNNVFANINSITEQVSNGTKQIADSSHSVAQGSIEQSSSITNLSTSVNMLVEKTRQNTEKARKAENICNKVRINTEKGSSQMNHMLNSIKEINDANKNIEKVVKLIDSIATQTSILALNASVEAARTGEHGREFTIIAEEVRNLAEKSAVAARSTNSFIANSIEKVMHGVQIAKETSVNLNGIFEGITQSTEIVSGIVKSSEEQVVFIDEINQGILEVSAVIQQNNAAAEESASTSYEISEQSVTLHNTISQYKVT